MPSRDAISPHRCDWPSSSAARSASISATRVSSLTDELDQMRVAQREERAAREMQEQGRGYLRKRLADAGQLSQYELATICGAVSEMRKNANDMMSSLDRDLPFP